MNTRIKQINLQRLEELALHLKELTKELVFLGGCTTALFITEKGAPDVRPTADVDSVVDVISLLQYHKVERRLSKLGFKQNKEVICRWGINSLILDVMPTNEKVLGFGNRWYKEAVDNSCTFELPSKTLIRTVTTPYFIATKIEAFKERGNNDFLASHDFEDIISVIDGRSELSEEIKASPSNVRDYLCSELKKMQSKSAFNDSLPGHFSVYGNLGDERISLFLKRFERLCSVDEIDN